MYDPFIFTFVLALESYFFYLTGYFHLLRGFSFFCFIFGHGNHHMDFTSVSAEQPLSTIAFAGVNTGKDIVAGSPEHQSNHIVYIWHLISIETGHRESQLHSHFISAGRRTSGNKALYLVVSFFIEDFSNPRPSFIPSFSGPPRSSGRISLLSFFWGFLFLFLHPCFNRSSAGSHGCLILSLLFFQSTFAFEGRISARSISSSSFFHS